MESLVPPTSCCLLLPHSEGVGMSFSEGVGVSTTDRWGYK